MTMSGNSGSERSGGCLCGAVRFSARNVPTSFGACHCEMCRRWTGSALLGVTVPLESVVWEGTEHIATRQTSDWAERAWCRECGSNLWFKVTMQGPYSGGVELPIGLFDDASGMTMTNEIWIDHKPDSFAYEANDRQILTRQQCLDKLGVQDIT